MKIVTWNINGINARTQHLLKWLKECDPDVVLLQEIKTIGDKIPEAELKAMGYQSAYVGQKSFNGVAILSKFPIEDPLERLPGDDTDDQARYLEATIQGIRFATLYFPNGNPIDSEKFDYKLAWMRRAINRTKELLHQEMPFVLGGDYNVAPDNGDVWDIERMKEDAICQEEGRAHYREMLYLGLTNALKTYHPESGIFSWWDYRGGGWNKDHGVLIDHLLVSSKVADMLLNAGVDKTPRGWEKASDHTPVWCEIDTAEIDMSD